MSGAKWLYSGLASESFNCANDLEHCFLKLNIIKYDKQWTIGELEKYVETFNIKGYQDGIKRYYDTKEGFVIDDKEFERRFELPIVKNRGYRVNFK